jgi:DNA-binding transcriptional ArsR family regulator
LETEAKNGSQLLPIWPNSKILTSMTQRAVFKQQARVLKALANESRLMIIDRLNKGECSVGELTDLVGSDVSTISKHLALLRANGIVEDRRQGTTVYYRLLTPCVCNFFVCATQVLKERSR